MSHSEAKKPKVANIKIRSTDKADVKYDPTVIEKKWAEKWERQTNAASVDALE